MPLFLVGAAILALLLGAAWIFVNSEPKALLRAVRYGIGAVLVVAGSGLALAGRISLGLMLIFLGVGAIAQGRIDPWNFGGTARSGGQGSKVVSSYVEMTLDHDSGTMSGRVLAGKFAGRELDDLDLERLRLLLAEIAEDADSIRLVEAYLDRREPGWREGLEEDAAGGARGSPSPGAMSEQEAYEILGLELGADAEAIRAAHRRLIKQVHPDQGGSTFLAAKINQAKDRLLRRHR